MAASKLGPVLSATLLTRDLDASMALYGRYLHQQPHSRGTFDADLAQRWRRPWLAGRRQAWLANALGEPWLRMVEVPQAIAAEPFRQQGWLSLEISVQDVDGLHRSLADSPLRIIGEPANLDLSDDIRAMQAIGPDGEVLYLTEVRAEVPPFELPRARCAVDRLFIPVLMAPDRNAALAVYESLAGCAGMRFDTRIGVINRARGLQAGHRHPVATLQLAGATLIEIDQLEGLAARVDGAHAPTAGIAAIGFAAPAASEGAPQPGLLEGAAGEWIELLAAGPGSNHWRTTP